MEKSEEEIKAGDKIIAEFDGKDYRDNHIVVISDSAKCKQNPKGEVYLPIKYHSSFEWLMPVGKKCKEIIEQSGDKQITDLELVRVKVLLFTAVQCFDITILWRAVVEFIKWYNKNNFKNIESPVTRTPTQQLLDFIVEQKLGLSKYLSLIPLIQKRFKITTKDGNTLYGARECIDFIIAWENNGTPQTLETLLKENFKIEIKK